MDDDIILSAKIILIDLFRKVGALDKSLQSATNHCSVLNWFISIIIVNDLYFERVLDILMERLRSD